MSTTAHIWKVAVVVAGCLLASCVDEPPANPQDYEPYEPEPRQQLDCTPNLDGVIEKDEFTARLNTPVDFLVSAPGQTRSIDPTAAQVDGRRVWDWSQRRASDQLATIEARAVSDQWFAGEFSDADFALPFSLGGETLAIFRETSSTLKLLGLASRQEEPESGKTLLVYDTPIDLYRFPLESDKSWTTSSDIQDGRLRGLPYAGEDTYEVTVGQTGSLRLPNLTFDEAHKIYITYRADPVGGQEQVTRQISFLFECFGEIARATSEVGESSRNFETAANVRRFGFR